MADTDLTPLGYPWNYGAPRGPNRQPSELSHGDGLTPRQYRNALPEDHGMYCGLTPRMGPEGVRSRRHHPPAQVVSA